MKFRSKIGPVLTVIAWAPILATTGVVIWKVLGSLSEGMSVGQKAGHLIPVLLMLLFDAFFVWMYATTAYTITDDDMLLVRSGFMRWQIPINSIQTVRRTRNPSSAPALSIDRLEVLYRDGFLLISPVERERFVAELVRRNPTIRTDA
jgi:hypothetical protein